MSSMHTPMDRLKTFAAAAASGPHAPAPSLVVKLVQKAAPAALPDDNRKLLKLAVTGIAFAHEVTRILRGHTKLDAREEALLTAALRSMAGGPAS